MISRDRIRSVLQRMEQLGIRPDDLEELFVRGSGAGGQKINKTSSTVVLKHVPTGIETRCQQERSLTQNRFLARQELCDKLEARRLEKKLALAAEVSRNRAINRKRTKGEKRAMTQQKRHRGKIKSMRSKPSRDD
jgi:protein subunit release factor B